ncbi:hypothetical protein [Pseudomonas sp. LRF_L74]|uniref:hypothetical protein n=1 Tax=Pseudomonas sp. LRF_L74 TaxID=3369422 RepID=UPI003F6168FC
MLLTVTTVPDHLLQPWFAAGAHAFRRFFLGSKKREHVTEIATCTAVDKAVTYSPSLMHKGHEYREKIWIYVVKKPEISTIKVQINQRNLWKNCRFPAQSGFFKAPPRQPSSWLKSC